MENQNAFNEEEYSAFRAETCTRIEIMNSQATSALTTALATWVMGVYIARISSHITAYGYYGCIASPWTNCGFFSHYLAIATDGNKERGKSLANGVARSIYSYFL